VYGEGFELEMLKVFANALNMSLDIASVVEVLGILIAVGGKEVEGIKGQPFIFVGRLPAVICELYNLCEYTAVTSIFIYLYNFNVFFISTISATSQFLVSFYILFLLQLS
jgi:hypothetical protein